VALETLDYDAAALVEYSANCVALREAMKRVLMRQWPTRAKLERKLERQLAAYFRGLKVKLPTAKIAAWIKRAEPVYLKAVEADTAMPAFLVVRPIREDKMRAVLDAAKMRGYSRVYETIYTLNDEVELIYRRWAEGYSEELAGAMKSAVTEAKADGFKGTMDEWIKAYGYKRPAAAAYDKLLPKDFFSGIASDLGTKVKGINEETARRLSKIVTDGLHDQAGVPGVARNIFNDLGADIGDMSRNRAKLIAQTETGHALGAGQRDANKALGVKQKEWISVGDNRVRDEHLANEADGRIPTDKEFSDGAMFAPDGVGCRCTTAYFGADVDKVLAASGVARA